MNTDMTDARTLRGLFRLESKALERQLQASADAKEAGDIMARALSRVRLAYLQKNTDADTARLTIAFRALEGAVYAMAAGADCRVETVAPPVQKKLSWKAKFLRYAPTALSAALAAWLLLESMPYPALTAVIAGALSYIAALKRALPTDAPDEARATPCVLSGELLRRMDALLGELDDLLEVNTSALPAPALTQDVLEATQMLVEAQLDNDGAFALKSVPQLVTALERQGLTLEMYSDAARAHFDLLPAATPGDTIRPAILAGDRVLSRGQATCERK